MTDSPNPVRTLESHGVEDQTSDEWKAKKSCLRDGGTHHMISVKTDSELVRYVEQCTDCSWIDPASLTWWAENAIKVSMSKRAQRIAIAASQTPFAFIQTSGEDLTLEEIIFQALGAASMCWIGGNGDLEFDSSRAKEIGLAVMREVDRAMHLVQHKGRTEAVS